MIRICHLSDIQIRTLSRHKEFRAHFANLYKSLKEKKPNAIVVAGDIVHQKMNVSPELFDITAEFFTNLANIAPTILIPGNHDCVLNNPSRMDVITPIVEALKNPNIHYFKHSGFFRLYEDSISRVPVEGLEDVRFAIFSCLDKEEVWPTEKDISADTINIGIFHGMIEGCQFENDFTPEDEGCYKLDYFLSKVDYLLLGDIHKAQMLDEDCRAGYCGSLIQQNYGESLKKGYFLWDIKSKDDHEVEFVELQNLCPFYTISLDSTLAVPQFDIQKGARIRVITPQLSTAEEKELRDELQKLYAPVEIKIVDNVNIANRDVKTERNTVKVENLRNVAVQEALIRNFLKSEALPEKTLESIFDINKKLNALLENEEDVLRNVRYKIKSLKFDNLFSFGAGNIIEYEKLRGINGVFGRNGAGKSSLVVDAPLYTLFNKISKEGAVKNNLYVNDQENRCDAQMEIEIGVDKYFIKRETEIYFAGKRTGNAEEKGRTQVLFEKLDGQGNKTNFTGEERSDTDKEIRKVFGTPEDFMITAVAPQFELINFLKNRGTDRKKTIGRYFDLDIFEKKCILANDELKILKKKIKMYEGKNFDVLLEDQRAKLETTKDQIQTKNTEAELLQKKKEDLDKEIWSLEQNQNNKMSVVRSTISEYETKQTFLEREVNNLTRELESFSKYLCVQNPDCCMKQKEMEVFVKLGAAKAKLLQNGSAIKDLAEQEKILLLEYSAEKSKLILEKKAARMEVATKLRELNTQVQALNGSLGAMKANITQLQAEQLDYEQTRRDFDAYHYFVKAMGKDGISYNIIAANLHVINAEIKKILGGTVPFEIFLEDEDKEVNIYLKHGNNKKRIIELCSGMEKTISAIAIRAALMSVTTLPIPNMIVFDEIFDSLDSDNLEAATKILQNLKRLFDVILIITHSPSVKDICDNAIYIERDEKGYSRIIV